jgi:hypothetical protein
VPKVKLGERYGFVGRDAEYTLCDYDRDWGDARAYVARLVREGRIKPAAEETAASDRAAWLRIKHYPRTWSRRERLKFYRKEVAAIEQARAERTAAKNAQQDEKRRRDSRLDELAERFKAIKAEEARHESGAGD